MENLQKIRMNINVRDAPEDGDYLVAAEGRLVAGVNGANLTQQRQPIRRNIERYNLVLIVGPYNWFSFTWIV